MNSRKISFKALRTLALVLLLAALSTTAWTKGQKSVKAQPAVTITHWLVTGPAVLPRIAFGELKAKKSAEQALAGAGVNIKTLWPSAGDTLDWRPGSRLKWVKVVAKGGELVFDIKDKERSAVVYAAVYLSAPRWMSCSLSLDSGEPLAVFLDGKQVAKREAVGKKNESLKAGLVLSEGLHRLLLVGLRNSSEKRGRWTLKAVIKAKDKNGVLPVPTLSKLHPMTLRDAYTADYVDRTTLSGDGALVCSLVHKADLATDKWRSYLRIRNTSDGSVVLDLKAFPQAGSAYFSPDGGSLVFQTPDPLNKKTRDLWLLNLKTHETTKLLSAQRNLRDVLWAPGGAFLYFIATAPRKRPKTPPPYERFTQMYQRWTGWQNWSHAFSFSMKDGSLHQLTAGPDTVQDMALSPDGKTLALLRIVHTVPRPYLITEIWTYDVDSGKSKRVLRWLRWPDVSELCFSPDGKKIAFVSSPTNMPPGGNKPKEQLAYDFDLFVLDLASGKTKDLTANFAPAVDSQCIGDYPGRRNVWWSPLDNEIYFIATDKSTVKLYRTDARGSKFFTIKLPDPGIGGPSMAASGRGFAYQGSSFNTYPVLRYFDLAHSSLHTLERPGEKVYARCEKTRHEDFDFTNKRGVPIQGWLFFPPNFDAAQKYPVVVAYYGGVVPYGNAFRPELFDIAGRGYVVYLLNPEGAVGYGPKFADAHMNDWGKKAGEDIIEGVRKLIKTKPYVDAKHVGCYGGSYGGFMTLYIVGHSDLFAAAVDMYGISDITSYWGAGWWGFNYGDTALANSYPWTRKDIFVGRSPVYFANRIHTPLLILHGDSDTNVPPCEAAQMFTAMRVQGRTCEYVRFRGENHGIHGTPKNALASDDMLFEWFDKYLKGEPGAWTYRWKNQPIALEK